MKSHTQTAWLRRKVSCSSAVANPLENQFSMIAGLNSMTSTNSLGATQITLEFDLSRKLDGAAVDVQAAITQAADHQLLVIDVAGGPRTAIEICAQVRSTPDLSRVPVLCVSASDDVEERIADSTEMTPRSIA